MIRFIYLSVAILISIRVSSQGFSSSTENKLQDVLASFQSNSQNPVVGGISAAIVVDGLATWKGSVGYAARNIDGNNNLLPGGTPFTTATPSHIYSATKPFTAALLLELVKDGAIDLNDPVIKYLPLLPQVNPNLNTDVSVRQLLAHESGYSNYTDEINLQIAVAFNPARLWNPYEMLSFVRQIAAPGAERRYSSTNYIILGAIIETATGKSIAQHFRTRFFAPLNLNSMYFSIQEQPGRRPAIAAPHEDISAFNPIFSLTGQPTFPSGYTNISAFSLNGILSLAFTSGGIVSDAEDLARWGNALFGGRATSSQTLDAMMKSIAATPDEDGDKLGYGIFESNKISTRDKFVGHDGNAPGYRSLMFFQPDRKLTIVVLTNYHGLDIYSVAKKLYEELPELMCGNDRNDRDKIQICYNGNTMCIPRHTVQQFIDKGAVLGTCETTKSSARHNADAIVEKAAGQHTLHLFPNPSKAFFNLRYKADAGGPVVVRMFDARGSLVSTIFSGTLSEGEVYAKRVSVSTLKAGVYIVSSQSLRSVARQKLIVQ